MISNFHSTQIKFLKILVEILSLKWFRASDENGFNFNEIKKVGNGGGKMAQSLKTLTKIKLNG